MIQDKISIRIFSSDLTVTTVDWPLAGYEYVEQLVFHVLRSRNVGPVYQALFGLRLIDQTSLWLAPNATIQDLLRLTSRSAQNESGLELRFRFRPFSYSILYELDEAAFNLVFSQIRHDFLNTRFNSDKKDFILLNDTVLGLITHDLVRHAIENHINIEELLKHVNAADFMPKKTPRWQRRFLFEAISLEKSIQVAHEKYSNDSNKIKLRYVESFLLDIAPDYEAEIYNVVRLERAECNSAPMDIRVRYQQDAENSNCVIEVNAKSKNSNDWLVLCDIEALSQGTQRDDTVQIARLNGIPLRFKFDSAWHAESFLSSLDGYYRLMRKWNFNLCRDVFSPDLENLKRLRCHGPIGLATTCMKLSELKRPGTYLLRRCMEKHDRYLIDALLERHVRLTIDVDYDASGRKYKIIGHSINTSSVDISITSDNDEYSSLKSLVADVQIRTSEKDRSRSLQQLMYLVQPSEHDDCPALLLSMSSNKLNQLESAQEVVVMKCINELPRFIPSEMLRVLGEKFPKIRSNDMIVKLALFNGKQEVVMKKFTSDRESIERNLRVGLNFHYCPKGHMDKSKILDLAQERMFNWIFVKNKLFAETIGMNVTNMSLIQEYFESGPLDKYLSRNVGTTSVAKLSISLQIAHALLFLQEKRIIHGKIRCHNIYVRQTYPMQVKLADPLGIIHPLNEQAFIPPEYYGRSGQICVKEYETGIDVWAFGTTLWQVYSQGKQPPSGIYANTLVQPRECSDEIWNLIESCWSLDPNCRASPQTLYRDMNDIFAWTKEAHDYLYISLEDSAVENLHRPPSSNTLAIPDENNSTDLSSMQSYQTNETPDNDVNDINNNNVKSKRVYTALTTYLPESYRRLGYSRVDWKSIINLRALRASEYRRFPSRLGSPSLRVSRLSLDSCCTPTGSNVTKLTDISDAIDGETWRIDSSRLKLGVEIGRGSNGIVVKGMMSQLDGTSLQVAVKFIDRDSSNYSLNKCFDLKREFDVLRNLKHKNIVKTFGFVEESSMMLVFEYMPLGCLQSCIKNSHDIHSLPLDKYARGIAKGMKYLEEKQIVHRDLALRNILALDHRHVKICDFGLAQFLGFGDNHYRLKTNRALPIRWYAPEAISALIFSHKSDVWSYGVVLWEIYSGGSSPQYSGNYVDLPETLRHERLRQPINCPDSMYNLMLACWAYEPNERDSFSQICEKLAHMKQNRQQQTDDNKTVD